MPPRKKPAELKIAEGNPGHRKVGQNLKPEILEELPIPPDWLTKGAKKQWDTLAYEMNKHGLLSHFDLDAFTEYCVCYDRWVECEKVITREGPTMIRYTNSGENLSLRPEVAMSKQYLSFLRHFIAEFGFSPSARARIVISAEEEEDEFNAFVNEGQRRAGA